MWFVLLRWLGPWTDARSIPPGIKRLSVKVPGEMPYEAWLYLPRRAAGAYLIAPGLQPDGPADPRLDRLCRVLAAAGFVVLSPFVPDYLEMRITVRAIADLDAALGVLLARPEVPRRPGIFAISFGSLLALRVAASEARRHAVAAVILFGGYIDLRPTMEFALTGLVGGQRVGSHDPLNTPAVFLNLPGLEPSHAVVDAWRAFVRETWGRPEFETGGDAWHAVARRHEQSIPSEERELYRLGVGLDPRSAEVALRAFDQHPELMAMLDSRPHLDGLRCPVHVMHGASDNVIPWTELIALENAIAPCAPVRSYLSGLYGHSGGAMARVGGLPRELWTLLRMLGGIASVAAC